MKTKTIVKKTVAIKKTRSREESVERFLQSALHMFSQHGYDATTTKMIASDAQLNEALINRYFGGKEGLLKAVLKNFIVTKKQEHLHTPVGETLYEEIVFQMRMKVHFFKTHKEIVRLMIGQKICDSDFSRDIDKKIFEDEETLIRFKKIQDKGRIKKGINLQRIMAVTYFSSVGLAFYMATASAPLSKKIIDEMIEDSARMVEERFGAKK